MEKPEILKARVSTAQHTKFTALCAAISLTPGAKLRELAESFIRENDHLLGARVRVHVARPEGYQEGAWQVSITLRDPLDMGSGEAAVPFPLPKLQKRRIAADKGFRAVASIGEGEYVLGGRFTDGTWRGHIYSNGCSEAQNPTLISEVEAALRSSVELAIERASGLIDA